MKNFLREHSYDAVKLLVMQIAISMFGLVLTLACGMAENTSLRTVCSVIAIVFYLFLIYTTIWDMGAKDAVSVEYGHKERKPQTGLWIALTANLPNFLLAVGILLGLVLSDVPAFSSVGGVSKMISLFLQGMYTGVLALPLGGVNLNAYAWVYFLTPMPAILCSWIAYRFGLKNRRFTRMFEWKTGQKPTSGSKKQP